MRILVPFLLCAGTAVAECPPVEDRSTELSGLIAGAQGARNEMVGRDFSDRMWAIWTDAPDEVAQDMLDRGMAARRAFDFLNALTAFEDLIAYCPDYAEGYNQRAFVRFLTKDFQSAVNDLQLALDREPRHVAALSGLALSLMGLGRADEAQIVLRRALALNPWIPERGLLTAPPGEDL